MRILRIGVSAIAFGFTVCGDLNAEDKQALKAKRIPPLSECRSISIWAPSDSGWWLEIRPNGGGMLGYGSTAFDAARLPAKTIEFARVYQTLKKPAFAVGSIKAFYSVTFRRKGASSNRALYSRDEAAIDRLFEQAKRNVRRVYDRKRFDEFWRRHPRLLPSTLEFQRLRGVWEIVSSTAGGRTVKGDVGRRWTFDGRKLYLGPRTGRVKPVYVSIDVDNYPRRMAWDIPRLRLPKNWKNRPPLGRRFKTSNVKPLPSFDLVVPKRALFGYRLDGDTLILGYKIKTETLGRELRMRYVAPTSLASDNGKYLMKLRRVKRLPVDATKPQIKTSR